MNIPYELLKKVHSISPTTFSFHQSISKKLYKVSLAKLSNDQSNILQPQGYVMQINLFNWFFKLNPFERLKYCSIQNKYLIQILHQEKTKFSNYHSYRYQIINNITNDLDLNKLSFSSFFHQIEPHFFKMGSKLTDQEEAEFDFLESIRYLSIDDTNDVMTLSMDLVNDKENFKRLFETISENACFTTHIKPYQHEDEKFYDLKLMEWTRNYSSLSIGQVMLMYFEHNLLMHYQHYLIYGQEFSPCPLYGKIQNILDQQKTVLNFILESGDYCKLYNTISFSTIATEIRRDCKITETISYYKENRYERILSNDKTICEQVDDTNKVLRKIYLESKERFVEHITFISRNILFKVEDFVCKKIFKFLYDKYTEKNASDLLDELTLSDKTNNDNKRKGKKKKKKQKEEEKEEIKEEVKREEPKREEKSIKVNNVSIEIIISPKEKDNNDMCNQMTQELIEENNKGKNDASVVMSHTEETRIDTIKDKEVIEDTTDNKEKKNKKKKDFFLFPLRDKKVNNSNKINNNKKNEINNNNNIKNDTITHQGNQSNSNHLNNTHQSDKEIKQEKDQNIKEIVNHQEIRKKSDSNMEFLPCNISNLEISNHQNNNHNDHNGNHLIYSQKQIPSNVNLSNPLFGYPLYQQYYNYGTYSPISYCSYQEMNSIFYMNLSKEIKSYTAKVFYHKNLIAEARNITNNNIFALINSAFENEYTFKIEYYGSYATDLSIESSDIDILIKHKTKNKEYEFSKHNSLLDLYEKLHKQKKNFHKITPIISASVPVIKLEIDIENLINQEAMNYFKNSFCFDLKEITLLKYDITFMEMDLNDPKVQSPSIKAVNFIKLSMILYPNMQEVIFVLKRYLQNQKLNSTYHGGLSSYSLFLLLYSLIKLRKSKSSNDISSGQLLIEFFSYYSSFPFNHHTINCNLDNPFVYSIDCNEQPIIILDPFTLSNVAKSSFLIDEIKFSFAKAMTYLSQNYSTTIENDNSLKILNGLFLL